MYLKFLLLYLSFLFISSTVFGQNIYINEDIDVEVSKLSIEEEDPLSGKLICSDVLKNDTIFVSMGRIGLAGNTVSISLTKGKIIPRIFEWSDYPMYDGESVIELELQEYDLQSNDTVEGETLKVKFTFVTKPNKYSKSKRIIGEIFHIIGGNKYEWKQGESFHHKYWKNGEIISNSRN